MRAANLGAVASHRAALAGLSICVAAYAGLGPAHGQCPAPRGPVAAAQTGPLYPPLQDAVDKYFAQYQAKDGFSAVGLLASLSADGTNISAVSGSRSRDTDLPLCPDTPFEIGSITKSFTSVLILRLEAAGVLSIHDTLGKWLPQYPLWSSVTIKQLLNMTAPIMTAPTDDYQFNPVWQQAFLTDIHRTWTFSEEIGYVYPGKSGPTPPWHYVNANYTLAAMIVERASGLSFGDALKKMLFDPLGLHDTYYRGRVPPTRLLDAMPDGYDYSLDWIPELAGQNVKSVNLTMYNAAGGIISTLPDVARWVRALFSDTLLPPRQKRELFRLVSESSGKHIDSTSASDTAGYSLGIGQNWDTCLSSVHWGYEGETLGYRVAWVLRPGDPLVLVAGFNSSDTKANNDVGPLLAAALAIVEPSPCHTGGAGTVTGHAPG